MDAQRLEAPAVRSNVAPREDAAPIRPIVLAAHQLFSVRYLLETDILHRLRELGAPIVILSPNADDPTFRARFQRDGVSVEAYRYDRLAPFHKGRIGRFFVKARWLALPREHDLSTVLFHERVERLGRERRTFAGRRYQDLVSLAGRVLRASPRARALFRRIEAAAAPKGVHADIFERHRPGLLVIPDVGTIAYSNPLAREAREHGAKVASVVLSWDNLTSKGMGGIVPDYAIAWNHTMRDELQEYHDVPPERISVSGVAHFDTYFRGPPSQDRATFLTSMGLSPDRATIFFGAASPSTFRRNADVVRVLLEAADRGAFSKPIQVLARIHPASLAKHKKGSGDEETFTELKARYGHLLALNYPPAVDQRHGRLLPIDDQRTLQGILTHSDVMVNVFSTLMLEACIHDLPVVNVALYNYRDTDIDNRVLETFTHLRKILRYGATRTAYDEDELVRLVDAYLGDPGLDRSERARVREREGGPNKGGAGRAIADQLFEWARQEKGEAT